MAAGGCGGQPADVSGRCPAGAHDPRWDQHIRPGARLCRAGGGAGALRGGGEPPVSVAGRLKGSILDVGYWILDMSSTIQDPASKIVSCTLPVISSARAGSFGPAHGDQIPA